ncbi:helix-turn-helix transcriptional regulator [Streptomyces lonarensis]|uniref:Helix-turn-helix transcriptional regulator n=1 Tax=Streptomyces lonarensis TaxID=700599 RepID=A0A7X6I0G2_9ACTN|nr:PadR family transcriptional regulator [Streptomyces lonarensis]NJQ07681.1 helix-turn-helix transcriptional regulator [Streptomyces lonarensis]
MAAVFGHGRLRLYLLQLLAESPRHGYELIRLLEERFRGAYTPSAGTIYPRLAKLAADGLIRPTATGGRKVYALTEAGAGELAARRGELAELERELAPVLARAGEARPGRVEAVAPRPPRPAAPPAPSTGAAQARHPHGTQDGQDAHGQSAGAAERLREWERLLDGLRDEMRDAARDHGVGEAELRTARRLLAETSAHLVALLASPDAYRNRDRGSADRP